MKKLLLILLIVPACAFASSSNQYCTIQNLSGYDQSVLWDASGGYGYVNAIVPPGGVPVYVPRGAWLQVYDGSNGTYPYDNYADSPLIYLCYSGSELIVLTSGAWEIDRWDALNLGLQFSVPVCGLLLGLWVFRRALGIGNGGLGED